MEAVHYSCSKEKKNIPPPFFRRFSNQSHYALYGIQIASTNPITYLTLSLTCETQRLTTLRVVPCYEKLLRDLEHSRIC